MRCRTCDYPLWNLEARTCPECGTPFRPSQFVFRPTAVTFRCPHCRQEYYGTSPQGHLEPSHFVCVGCARPISMDEMTLEPAPGVREDDAGRPPNPWLERKRLGFWRGWWRSVLGVLTKPSEFAESIPRESNYGQPILFALVTLAMSTALGMVVGLVFSLAITTIAVGGGNTGAIPAWQIAAQQGGMSLLGLVLGVVGSFVFGAITHLCLRILGGAAQPLRMSIVTLLYAQGAVGALNLLVCIPCINWISAVWWIVSGSVMLRVVHRTSTGKAVTAVLAPAAVSILLVLGAVATVFTLVVGGPGRAFPTPTATAQAGPSNLLAAKLAAGEWPETPLHAIADGYLDPSEFLAMVEGQSDTNLDGVRIGGLDEDDIIFGSRDVLERGGAALAKSLPAAGPYRIGELVVCWPGIGHNALQGWLLVVRGRAESGEAAYIVVQVIGQEVLYDDLPSFEAARAAENGRRRSAGEPEIPAWDDVPVVPLAP